jgi:hypothetical protein
LLSELNSKINYESSLSIIIEKLENQGQSLTKSLANCLKVIDEERKKQFKIQNKLEQLID